MANYWFYFLGFLAALIACFISGASLLVVCQWGCNPILSPAVYFNISFWLFLGLTLYFVIKFFKAMKLEKSK